MEITFIILYSITFLALLIASYTDLKTREVPDWLSYSLIFTGIGLRLIFSVYYNNYSYIIEGIAGLVLFVAIAFLMFYAGQWGGGDSKMLMALGALFGISLDYNSFSISFFINLLLVGAVYGLLYSLYQVLNNWKAFKKELSKFNFKKHVHYFIILVLALSIIIYFSINDIYLKFIFISWIFFILFTIILWQFVKIVEKACMLKLVNPNILTEGDWIAKEVKYKGNVIAGPKDLGLSKKQIKLLANLYNKKKIDKVVLKIGIPFIPSFLIAFIITLIFGNMLKNLTNLFLAQ